MILDAAYSLTSDYDFGVNISTVEEIDTAVAALELAALQAAHARAEQRARAKRVSSLTLAPQIEALARRVATLETQADDDRVLLFVLPHTFL